LVSRKLLIKQCTQGDRRFNSKSLIDFTYKHNNNNNNNNANNIVGTLNAKSIAEYDLNIRPIYSMCMGSMMAAEKQRKQTFQQRLHEQIDLIDMHELDSLPNVSECCEEEVKNLKVNTSGMIMISRSILKSSQV
jgi:hypothetical protein